MTEHQAFGFGAYVVGAAFLGEVPAFALGDGTVRRIVEGAETVVDVHDGAILVAAPSRDGRSLVTAGDDGAVFAVDAEGAPREVARRPGKWIDQLATGPDGAIAFAAGRRFDVRLRDGREKVLD